MTIEATKTLANQRVLLTIDQAAEALAVGRTTLCRLIRTGQVATVQIGRLRRVPLDALHTFAKEQQR
jgi:excisionase family DNA binding protein